MGSSSKQACCWLAGAPPAPQTSGVCAFVCVCEGKVFPAATYPAPKEPQLKQTVFGMNLSFVRASIWSAVLCDSFPLWKKRAKNSSQWPGNAAIDFILVEKKHIKDILSLLLTPLFLFLKKRLFIQHYMEKYILKKLKRGITLCSSYLIRAAQRRWDKLVCVSHGKCLASLGHVTGVWTGEEARAPDQSLVNWNMWPKNTTSRASGREGSPSKTALFNS